MKDATIGGVPPAIPSDLGSSRRGAVPATESSPEAAGDGFATGSRSGSAPAKGLPLTDESHGKAGGGMPLSGVWSDISGHVGAGVFPGNLFAHRSTDFDRYVITARFLRAYSHFPLTQKVRTSQLLDAAAASATRERRVDQLMWLSQAYKGEFADMPAAAFKSIRLQADAMKLLQSGQFEVAPFQYPGLDYGLIPMTVPFGAFYDPFAPDWKPPVGGGVDPATYDRNTRNVQALMRMMEEP